MTNASDMYWSPVEVLPFQRIFNFINGPRSIGKTYSCLKWLIRRALDKGEQFAYIVRTQDEKKAGVLEQAVAKVVKNEFKNLDFAYSSENMLYESETIAWCFALTEVVKLKRRSFPEICWMIFDEYTIEDGTARYINGYQEPELFVNLYHTIDREEDRVKCFFMGNNTSYYNPYHLYPLFGLPGRLRDIEPGDIWKNKVSLFQRAIPKPALLEKRKENRFLNAATGTRYGDYAVSGEYRDDGYQPIQKLGPNAMYRCTIHCPDGVFSCFSDAVARQVIFSEAIDSKYSIKFSLVRDGYKDGFPYYRPDFDGYIKLFKAAARQEQLFYESMSIKSKLEPYLIKVL